MNVRARCDLVGDDVRRSLDQLQRFDDTARRRAEATHVAELKATTRTQRASLRAAEEHRLVMMGDRGVLMEELLMAMREDYEAQLEDLSQQLEQLEPKSDDDKDSGSSEVTRRAVARSALTLAGTAA